MFCREGVLRKVEVQLGGVVQFVVDLAAVEVGEGSAQCVMHDDQEREGVRFSGTCDEDGVVGMQWNLPKRGADGLSMNLNRCIQDLRKNPVREFGQLFRKENKFKPARVMHFTNDMVPVRVASVPRRTAKYNVVLQEHALWALRAQQEIITNMVMFDCKVCIEEFPAFHPAFDPPPEKL